MQLTRAAPRVVLPAAFRPAKLPGLVRLGSDAGGGYVVSEQDVLNSDFLLSCGLNDDWSFEADFIKANSVPAICYDGSVSSAY